MVIRDIRYFENRIALMQGNGKENANIIKKCERQIRKLKKQESK